MTSARFHPLAAVTAVVFLVAVLLPPISFGVPFTFAALLAFLGLASPFVVLLLAHIQICKTWRRNLLVVLLNVPLFLGWQLAVVATWYLQAGLLGALVFGTVLSGMAAAGLLLTRLIKEPKPTTESA